MHKKVKADYKFAERELETLKFWKENNILEKSISIREGSPSFTFFDGPPTANGMPHIGHVLTRVVKDIIPRYKTMKGFKVLRKAGWDTHGLPVELEVEKQLGIDGKEDIEKHGVEDFINDCKKSVWKYQEEWEKMTDRVAFWLSMEDPYITYNNSYIESVWWALKQIWDKGLLYKSYKVVPYCARCGTALSSHEVAQGYEDVKEESIFVKFRIKGKKNDYLMAWTTTPWTLPSNVALAVSAKETYAKVKNGKETYILAKELVEKVIGENAEILEEFKGSDLEGTEYEPLFDFAIPDKKCWFVVTADFVTLTDGTGIVHIAPAFGEDDSRIGREKDLPFIQMVAEDGKFKKEAKPYKGTFVKDADPIIIKDLDRAGLLFKTEEYEHSYPFCWRCHQPLLYYARETWFIKMTALRDKLIANNKKINWMPENIRDGRFGNFLENVVDWGLSRERYWGTPLPIWECKCGHRVAVGSIKELKELGKNVPENIELHKPYIDNVKLNCPECKKGEMTRVTEVIDCWFDSGSMPFAQWHYPFENKDIFEDNFPADFISEAIDQTRGWFYSLVAISTLLFDKPAFENVIVLGHVLDKDGQKMSKHKGNVVAPSEAFEKVGADAIRWFFFTRGALWLPSRFDMDAITEVQRKFMVTLWNTYAFYVLYANTEDFDYTKYKLDYDKLSLMDKWVLSKLNSLVKSVNEGMEKYQITESARSIMAFTEELSNWFVRGSRRRFWQKEIKQDKINAFMTLFTALNTVTKLSAPFVPFISEQIYQNLIREMKKDTPESVHLCDYPETVSDFIDPELEKNMDQVIKIVELGRACRNLAQIKVRQPLKKMHVSLKYEPAKEYNSIILDELNIRGIEFTDDLSAFVGFSLKPNFKSLGAKYGKMVPKIVPVLGGVDGSKVKEAFDAGRSFKISIGGTDFDIEAEDVTLKEEQKTGFVSVTEHDITIVLDTNLNDELIEEGFVREIISKLQNLRKDTGLEVEDRIEFYYDGSNKKISSIIEKHGSKIAEEILATGTIKGITKCLEPQEFDINGEKAVFAIKKSA